MTSARFHWRTRAPRRQSEAGVAAWWRLSPAGTPTGSR
jgi:hypothetical protein